jgi:hypothetical protein
MEAEYSAPISFLRLSRHITAQISVANRRKALKHEAMMAA